MQKAFRTLFDRVRAEGKLVSGESKIGGMWHADIWRLQDVSAWLTDDGATRILKAPGLEVRECYDGTLVYDEGTAMALGALAEGYGIERRENKDSRTIVFACKCGKIDFDFLELDAAAKSDGNYEFDCPKCGRHIMFGWAPWMMDDDGDLTDVSTYYRDAARS